MKVIYKYELEITDEQQVKMRHESRLLKVDVQNDKLCLWVLVDTTYTEHYYTFRIIGTGRPIDEKNLESLRHVDTIQMPPFVWHLFLKLVYSQDEELLRKVGD